VLGDLAPLDNIFSIGPIPISGDGETVMLSSINIAAPYKLGGWATHFRMCIDMGDLPGAQAIHAPGQSGNLGSEFYDNLVDLWDNAQYHPMLWTKEQVLQNEHYRLELLPRKN